MFICSVNIILDNKTHELTGNALDRLYECNKDDLEWRVGETDLGVDILVEIVFDDDYAPSYSEIYTIEEEISRILAREK